MDKSIVRLMNHGARAFLLCFVAGVQPGIAAADLSEVSTFDIQPQQLPSALLKYSEQSGVQVTSSGVLIEDRTSPGVVGRLDARRALASLLRNTDLGYDIVDHNTVVITPPAFERLPDPSSIAATPTASSVAVGELERAPSAPRSAWARFRVAQASSSDAAQSDTGQNNSPDKRSEEGVSASPSSATSESNIGLGEVVVTATKRSERLKDIPVSVSVLGSAALESQQAVRLQDYFAQVPGLQVNPTNSGRLSLAIRGITTGGSANPTVGVVIDDVPVGSSSSLTYAGLMAADIDPATLERIEVLRGPQGTLYGAASLGGLLRYVTAKPKMNVLSGRFQVDGSDVDTGENGYGARGTVNVPLVDDKLAAVFSGFFRHDPGVIDDLSRGKEDVDSADVWGGRLSTLWQANENVSLRVSATYQSSEGDGSSNVISNRMSDLTSAFTQDYIVGSGSYERKVQQYDATLNIDLGWADLTSISAYGISRFLEISDTSATFGGLVAAALLRDDLGSLTFLPSETKKFSQEVRLASPTGEKLEWLAGLFYTDEDSDTQYNIFGSDLTTGELVGVAFPDAFPITFEERAVFGSATYHFTDRFDVQLGGRYSENEQVFDELITGPLYPVAYEVHAESKDDSFTYLVSPRFKISPNNMVYGRVATGYRPGGPNPGAGFGTPAEYAADTTTSYELGWKTELLDRRVSLDASVYYIDWKDIQLQQIDPVTQFVFYTNAGKATSQGADLTVQAVPREKMTVTGTLAYTDAELASDTNGNLIGSSGDPLPFSAELTASLAVDQEFPLSAELNGFVGGSVNYLGERNGNFPSSAGVPRVLLDSFTTLDLRAGVRNAGWTFSVFARNLTNEEGVLGGAPETAGGGTGRYVLTLVRPRTIGLSVAREF